MNIQTAWDSSYNLHKNAGPDQKNINDSESLKYSLGAMQAGDMLETIIKKGIDTIILGLLYPKRSIYLNHSDYAFKKIGTVPDLEIGPDIAKIMMDAKDDAAAIHGVRGATSDISHRTNYAVYLKKQFPNIGNVKILSLPGPASTMMLSKIQELGIGKDNTTIASTNGKLGGIWNDEKLPGVSNGTKINPGDFLFDQNLILPAATHLSPGSGKSIQQFVTQLGNRLHLKKILKSEVTKVEQNSSGGYLITFKNNNGKEYQDRYDIVLFGPGAHINIPFSNNRIEQVDENNNELILDGTDKDIVQTFLGSNIRIESHRWQEDPSSIPSIMHKLKEDPNAELLFHGFGNSTIGSVKHCIENNIKFRVISDNPIDFFWAPDEHHWIDGKKKMLARNLKKEEFDPQTGIAYDYKEVEDLIIYLLDRNLIETDVKKVQWKNEDGKYYAHLHKKNEDYPKSILTINENYCLYGYKPDTHPIKDLVERSPRGITATDWTHQGLHKDTGKSLPGLFIHGLAAYGANNAVLPGIGYDTPATMVSTLIHSMRLHEDAKI